MFVDQLRDSEQGDCEHAHHQQRGRAGQRALPVRGHGRHQRQGDGAGGGQGADPGAPRG